MRKVNYANRLFIWNQPNEGATNKSGFTELPAGDRNQSNIFQAINDRGSFWTVNESSSDIAFYSLKQRPTDSENSQAFRFFCTLS